MVSSGIGHHQKTSLPEVLLDLPSESPRSGANGTWSGQHSWLAPGVPRGDDADISRVLSGNDG